MATEKFKMRVTPADFTRCPVCRNTKHIFVVSCEGRGYYFSCHNCGIASITYFKFDDAYAAWKDGRLMED